MSIMKKNPAKGGFLCDVFKINNQGMREYVMRIVVVAKTREEATAIVDKSIKYDPAYKFTLKYINVFS